MHSFWRTLAPGVGREILLVLLADGVVGASFGAVAVSGGLPLHVPVLLSLLVFAGGSQFAAVAVVVGGGSVVAAVVAGVLLNTRLLPYGLALADVVDGPWWRRAVAGQVVTDESTAFALRPAPLPSRRAAFWVSGLALYVVWNLAVLGGALAGSAVGDPDRIGLDAAFPAVIVALVLPALRARRTVRAQAAVGAVIAVAATPLLPAGLPVLLALVGLLARPRGAS